ncbi:hypothetical protein JCM8547_002513 [Rhodosporidiobolus lusitaniae]
MSALSDLSIAVQEFYLRDYWTRYWWSLVGRSHKHFELVDLWNPVNTLPRYDRPEQHPVAREIWQDEAYKEKRIDKINGQSVYYESLARDHAIPGLSEREKAMAIATAANYSSIIPLDVVLASFERLAAARQVTDFAANLMFAAVVVEHVIRAGRPSLVHIVCDCLNGITPFAFEVCRHDLKTFMRSGVVSESRRMEDKNRLLALVQQQVEQRRLTVRNWSPPFHGVMVGACQSFEPSMIDAYIVKDHYLDRNYRVTMPPPPAYQHGGPGTSPPPSRRQSTTEGPPAYNSDSPFHAGTRSPQAEPLRVLERHPSFSPPSYQ